MMCIYLGLMVINGYFLTDGLLLQSMACFLMRWHAFGQLAWCLGLGLDLDIRISYACVYISLVIVSWTVYRCIGRIHIHIHLIEIDSSL